MKEIFYPKNLLEVIVIDDASTDSTLLKAKRFAKNFNFIKVIQCSSTIGPRGKPEALNCALKYAKGDIVYCFDADYYPQRDIFDKLNAHFINPKVGAVQGRVTVLNDLTNLLTRLIALERIGGYRVDQFARNQLELVPQYGGTVEGFRKEVIERLGGWDPNILAEDTDLTFRIYLAGLKVKYINGANCYEEAVEDWGSYWKQRSLWAKGHMQCAFRHLWSVIKSKNMSDKEKIDGILLLNIYFIPILTGLAWIFGGVIFFLEPENWINILWIMVPLGIYSSVGNFAPFFEVGVGVYLDKKNKICLLIPLLFLTFVLNMFICSKALLDLCFSRIVGKKRHIWLKTTHNGNGHKVMN